MESFPKEPFDDVHESRFDFLLGDPPFVLILGLDGPGKKIDGRHLAAVPIVYLFRNTGI